MKSNVKYTPPAEELQEPITAPAPLSMPGGDNEPPTPVNFTSTMFQGERAEVVEPVETPEMEAQQQADVDIMADMPAPDEIDFSKVDRRAGIMTNVYRQTKNFINDVSSTTLSEAKPKVDGGFKEHEAQDTLDQLNAFTEKNRDVVWDKDDKPNFQIRDDYEPDLLFDLSSMDDGEDISLAVKAMADMLQTSVNKARRGDEGVLRDEEVRKLAKDLLQDPIKMLQILQKPDGQTANVEEIMAMGMLWKQSAGALNQAIKDANKEGATAGDFEKFQNSFLFQAKLYTKIMAYRAEGARALRIQGQAGINMNEDLGFSANELMDLAFSGYDSKTLAKLMQGAQTADAMTHKIEMTKSLARQMWDKAMEHWLLSILSGPTTQMVNLVSVGAQLGINNIDRFIAESSTRAMMMFGKDTSRLVAPGETMSYMIGEVLSFKQSLKTALEVLKTGDVYDGGKFVSHKMAWSADSWEKFGLDPNGIGANALAFYAKHINGGMVTHVMGATDAMGKVLGENAELVALTYRQVYNEIAEIAKIGDHTPEELNAMFMERYTHLLEHPSIETIDASRLAGQKVTFQDPTVLGQKLKNFLSYTVVGKIFIPFVNTPLSSLSKNLIERTPGIGFMASGARDGGVGTQMALAKQTTGLAIIGYFGYLNESGNFNASAPDYKASQGRKGLALWEAQKRMELSYMTDDEFQVYLGRIEQISYLAQVVGDLNVMLNAKEFEYETEDTEFAEKIGDITNTIFGSVMNNLSEKAFLQGFADFSELVDRGNIVEFMAKRSVDALPFSSLRRQLTQSYNPVKKDTKEYMDKIKAQLFWLANEVPNKLDLHGNEVPIKQPLSIIKWGRTATMKTAPGPGTYVVDAMAKMAKVIYQIPYGKPSRKREGIELSSRQYHDYQLLGRKNLKYEGRTFPEIMAEFVKAMPSETEADYYRLHDQLQKKARELDDIAWKVYKYGSDVDDDIKTVDGKKVPVNTEILDKLRKMENIKFKKKGISLEGGQ